MTNHAEIQSEEHLVRRIDVLVPDPDPIDGFEAWVDRLTATWDEPRGWWLICGDNTGSENLIVHPYQIPGLIKLLLLMAEPAAEHLGGER